jgi:hypothetical protein
MSKAQRLVAFGVCIIASAGAVRLAHASDHTYGQCLQAASYQFAECTALAQLPGQSFDYEDCLDTFYYLRDDPNGCHQFAAT